jgi:hypothetical protein|uniref:Uncharacterized protein n=1 Tax=Zea mays TaxID=4577 RepID=A0A804U6N7_MAIZE
MVHMDQPLAPSLSVTSENADLSLIHCVLLLRHQANMTPQRVDEAALMPLGVKSLCIFQCNKQGIPVRAFENLSPNESMNFLEAYCFFIHLFSVGCFVDCAGNSSRFALDSELGKKDSFMRKQNNTPNYQDIICLLVYPFQFNFL